MLKILFSKRHNENDGNTKPAPADAVTVACPDHLVLADLPVAKSLGRASVTAVTKIVGRRSSRQPGERVNFCAKCDFPIAIYGRLSPCEHAFCLDCAKSDPLCFICDERVMKIQTIKKTGVYMCEVPCCLKSFLGKAEFESHINNNHASNHPNNKQEGNHPTFRATPGPVFSPLPAAKFHDRDGENQHSQFGDQPPSRSAMHLRTIPQQLAAQTSPLPSPPLLPAPGCSQTKRGQMHSSGRGFSFGHQM